MKKTAALLLALLLSSLCVLPAAAADTHYYLPSGEVRMIAHRGYSAVAPENTLPAYRAAGEAGFWGAECDIIQTADGVWVLMHDSTVDRMTNGTGSVRDLTYAQISALTVDAGNGLEKYPNEKVPTLEEYLDVCKDYGLHPVIEIKQDADAADMDGLAEFLMAREEREMFVIISFGRELCARIKALMPETPVYYLVSTNAAEEDISFAVKNRLDGMDINCGVSDDYVKAIQKAGLDVIVWTVDDLPTAQRFFRLGVSAVTTNTLTPENLGGNLLQRFIWSLRGLLYRLTQAFGFHVGTWIIDPSDQC